MTKPCATGYQSPSVCEPAVEEKIELLHLMNALGIDTADIGLPGAGVTTLPESNVWHERLLKEAED
jgi:hypothetical protein